jgi:hypothetical protein
VSVLLARRLRIDVTSDLTLASGWLELKRPTDFDPNITSNVEDATAYDTNGISAGEVTMIDAAPTVTWLSQVVSSVRDPGQTLVMATVGQFGTAARFGMRWYDKNGLAGPDNGSGVFLASIKRAATGVKNLESVTATCAVTDGILNIGITNPGTAAAVPVILSATPTAQSVGKILTITGVGFTGVTGASSVTIGGTNATSYVVQSDNMITAVVPAGSAGSAAIIVTNGVGASASFPYTRGA